MGRALTLSQIAEVLHGTYDASNTGLDTNAMIDEYAELAEFSLQQLIAASKSDFVGISSRAQQSIDVIECYCEHGCHPLMLRTRGDAS